MKVLVVHANDKLHQQISMPVLHHNPNCTPDALSQPKIDNDTSLKTRRTLFLFEQYTEMASQVSLEDPVVKLITKAHSFPR